MYIVAATLEGESRLPSRPAGAAHHRVSGSTSNCHQGIDRCPDIRVRYFRKAPKLSKLSVGDKISGIKCQVGRADPFAMEGLAGWRGRARGLVGGCSDLVHFQPLKNSEYEHTHNLVEQSTNTQIQNGTSRYAYARETLASRSKVARESRRLVERLWMGDEEHGGDDSATRQRQACAQVRGLPLRVMRA